MTVTKWRRHLVWLFAFAMVLAACGDDGGTAGTGGTAEAPEECTEPDSVRLQSQWFAQSQFAGYYVAKDLGFYEEQCLEVEILEGGVDIVPQQVLATGGAEFGTGLGAQGPGLPVRAAPTSSTSPRCSSAREPCRCPGPTPGSPSLPTGPGRPWATGDSATSSS